MIIIHDKFVEKYLSSEHIGENPGILAYLFNTMSYKEYCKKISKVSKDLSQFSSSIDLVPYLIKNYGLSLNQARDFVNKNVTYSYKKGNSIDKKCISIHTNNNLEKASDGLEKLLE